MYVHFKQNNPSQKIILKPNLLARRLKRCIFIFLLTYCYYKKIDLFDMSKCRNCGEGFIPKKSSFCSEDCAYIHTGNLFLH